MTVVTAQFQEMVIPRVPRQGVLPWMVARNGTPPGATNMASLSSFINMLCGVPLKVLSNRTIRIGDLAGSATAKTVWRDRFHTSKNCTEIIIDTVCRATTVTAGWQPRFRYVTNGGLTKHHPWQYPRAASGVGDGWHLLRQKITDLGGVSAVIRNTTSTLALEVEDGPDVIASTVYEVPRLVYPVAALSGGTDLGVQQVTEGAWVRASVVSGYYDAITTVWKRGGSRIFGWAVPDSTAVGVTGTTPTNILDGSTSHGTNTAGFTYRSKDRGSRASNNIPVVFWVYAGATAASGKVDFVNSGGVISTITVSTSTGYFASSANLDASITSQKIDVHAYHTTGGQTCNVQAAGCYEFAT